MQKTKSTAFILSVLTMSFFVGYLAFAAWTEPSQSPPLGNVAPPINTGTIDQIKSGGLSVGAFVSQYGTILANVSGSVGVGTASPTQKLDVAGYVKGQSGLCIGSDCRTSWPSGGGGGVTSVSNSDGTLTISPTTGAVVAFLNLGHANTWTGAQTFTANTNFPGSGIWNASGNMGIGTAGPTIKLAIGDSDTGLNWAGDGQLDLYSNNVNTLSVRNGRVGIGTNTPVRPLAVFMTSANAANGRHTAAFTGVNGYGVAIGGLRDLSGVDKEYGSIQAYLSSETEYQPMKRLVINPLGGFVTIGADVSPNRALGVYMTNLNASNGVHTAIFQGVNGYGVAIGGMRGGDGVDSTYGSIQAYQEGVGMKNLAINLGGGNVGIGTPSPTYTLTVYGTAWVSTTWSSGSDIRWKKDIIPLENSLAKIIQLQGISYDWRVDEFPELKFPSGRQIGLIAQEVEQIIPEIVSTDQNGYKGISYEKLTPVLVEAIKEQQKQIEELRNEIEILKQK